MSQHHKDTKKNTAYTVSLLRKGLLKMEQLSCQYQAARECFFKQRNSPGNKVIQPALPVSFIHANSAVQTSLHGYYKDVMDSGAGRSSARICWLLACGISACAY